MVTPALLGLNIIKEFKIDSTATTLTKEELKEEVTVINGGHTGNGKEPL